MAATASTRAGRARPEAVPGAPATPARPVPRAAAALIVFLLALIAYAAFDHGATSLGAQARIQSAAAAAVVATACAWLWRGPGLPRAWRTAWLGLGLLVAFAVWAGLSLTWSVAPDRTWIELNRALVYVIVVALGLAAAARWDRAAERLVAGYLVVALLVALYALGGKVIPGVDVLGVDFNHTRLIPRLRAPLDYWNALALVTLLAAPLALSLAVDRARPAGVRLGALIGLSVLLDTIGLTYSRGGVLALIVAVALFARLGGEAVRSLAALGLALLATVPTLVIGFATPSLSGLQQPLSARESDGALLGVVLVVSLVALLLAGRAALQVDARVRVTPAHTRRLAVALAALLCAGALSGGIALATSERGFTGAISQAWSSFRKPKFDPLLNPSHLITTNSGNRWTWWSEAVGAFADRPVAGWGAGTFPVVHNQYRTNDLNVLQPHSVPLQLLTETGLVGFLLGFGGLVALAVAGVGRVRSLGVARPRDGPEASARLAAAALAAAAIAWIVHGTYDWDLDIPGATLPALAFLGVLAARGQAARPRPRGRAGPAWALAGVTAGACAIALSALLPAWADGLTNRALGRVSVRQRQASLQAAARDAELAARLNPIAADPLLALASIDQGRGRPLDARAAIVRAIRREPSDAESWRTLLRLDFDRGDYAAMRAEAGRALALNPRDRAMQGLLLGLLLVRTPPNDSATAAGTPLPEPAPAPVGGAP